MFKGKDEIVFLVLTALMLLSISIGKNPWPSALAVLIITTYKTADKYFHYSFHDETKHSITQLKAEFAKLKASQDRQDMKSAFGGTK